MREIYYLHGFRSAAFPGTGKVAVLEQAFPECRVVPVQYEPHRPVQTQALLESLFDGNTQVALVVGTSLGGFWSLYAARLYGVRGAMFNPSLAPFDTLQPGRYENYATGSSVVVTEADITAFRLARENIVNSRRPARIASYIATDDEVIDPGGTLEFLNSHEDLAAEIRTYPCGGHRFIGFGDRQIIDDLVGWTHARPTQARSNRAVTP